MSTSNTFNIPSEETQKERNDILYLIASKMGAVDAVSARDLKALVRLDLHKRVPVGEEYVSERETALTISIGDSAGITAASVDEEVFLGAVGEAHEGVYEAAYDGAAWHREDGTPILLADYGISVTGTPAEGDHIVVTETAAKIVWQLADHDKCCASGERSAVLISKDTVSYGAIPFSMPQLLFYFPNGLEPGHYRFGLLYGAFGGVTGQDGAYEFTTTQAIPAGGGIRHTTIGKYQSDGYTRAQITGGTITTYGAAPERAVIESGISVMYESSLPATNIGTVSARDASRLRSIPDVSKANYTERNFYGSNRYAHSCCRKWLNSAGKAVASGDTAFSNWWTPSDEFDMPPAESVRKSAGFLFGLDPDLADNIGEAAVAVESPSPERTAGAENTETLNDKVFLLSKTELYGGTNISAKEGDQLALFAEPGSAARIRCENGVPRLWWTRSALSSAASYAYRISTVGDASGYYVNTTPGLVCGVIIKAQGA